MGGRVIAVAVSSTGAQTVLMLCAFASLIIGFVFLVRPPRFLKPDWLLAEEGSPPRPEQ